MTIAEAFKVFGTALNVEFTNEQSVAEVLSAIAVKFGGTAKQTIADAANEIAKVADHITAIGDATIIEKSITANGEYNATTEEADAYNPITVNVQPVLEDVNVTPTTSAQTVAHGEGYDGIGTVSVAAVTSAIDANITAENIKSGVTILGVEGTYTGE